MDNFNENSMNCISCMFKIACVVSAISMTIYCSVDYSKNEDTSTVSYMTLNGDESSPYPQFAFCFYDYSWEVELTNKMGLNVDVNSFKSFYFGEKWNKQLPAININEVLSKIKGIVIDTCVKGKMSETNKHNCDEKGILGSDLFYGGRKCLTFHYTKPKAISSAHIWIKALNFSETEQNFAWYGKQSYPWNNGMSFTFPHQFLNPNYPAPWHPPMPSENNTSVKAISVYLRGIEVIRHRNKVENPCYDWKGYDSLFMKEIYLTVGCKPFYSNLVMEQVPNCTSKEDIKRIFDMGNTRSGNIDPCIELRQVSMIYQEDSPPNIMTENNIYSGIGEKLGKVDDWFRVSTNFMQNTYKDIQQTRAYTVQSLIGNAGGYLGLFVGYTISEIPWLLMMAYKILKQFVSTLW